MANQPNQQPFFGIDSFVDSDDLMSWLLLNPEVDFEAAAHMQQLPSSSSSSMPQLAPWNVATDFFPQQHGFHGQQSNVGGGFDFPPRDPFVSSLSFQQASLTQDTWKNGFGSANPQTQLKIETAPRNKSSSNLTQSSSMQDLASVATTASPRNSKRPTTSASGASKPKKRPRESLEDLEARVNSLKAENADLHAHLLNVTQRTTEVFKQRSAMERLMTTKLAELGGRPDGDQSELAQIVKQYTDIYADYGKCRQREVFVMYRIFKLNQSDILSVTSAG
ncbi:hypothetical protein EON65_33435 [archaeon]|nr:MAG: hypothetical protein EON65_33435 [archaeon]